MALPTHRITVEVTTSEDGMSWDAVLSGTKNTGRHFNFIGKSNPAVIKVEEIPRPIVAGDVVRNRYSRRQATYEVVAVRGDHAWITGIGSSTNLLVYFNNLTRV